MNYLNQYLTVSSEVQAVKHESQYLEFYLLIWTI